VSNKPKLRAPKHLDMKVTVEEGRKWQDESVFVATPTRNDSQTNYVISLLNLQAHDYAGTQMVARGGMIVTQATPMNLPTVRNTMVKGMLTQTKADWLLFLDADAGFAPDIAERLVEAADPVTRPIVGALAFMVQKRASDNMGGWTWDIAPTIYGWKPDDEGNPGFVPRLDYPENTIVPVAATGCHALLIHRGVLEKIEAELGPQWFERFAMAGYENLGQLGEDFAFCVRARTLGYPVHVHTGVRTTHQQTVWIGEEVYEDLRTLAAIRRQVREAAEAEAAAESVPA
jgi:hypothetical protein